jgi:MFS family permease
MRGRYEVARYLVGSVGARTGDEASGPALLLLALGVTGSAVAGSAVLAGLSVTTGIGGPLFGVLLDRARRPGRLLALALAVYAAGLLALAGVLVAGLPVGVAVLVAAVTGLFGPALNSGWTAQLPARRAAWSGST